MAGEFGLQFSQHLVNHRASQTSHSPSVHWLQRSELQLHTGPSLSLLRVNPTFPAIPLGPGKQMLLAQSQIPKGSGSQAVRFLSHLEGLIKHRVLGPQGFLLHWV